MTSRRFSGRGRAWPLGSLVLVPAATTGCSQAEATVFGKILFAMMLVFFIVVPIVFWRAWRRDRG